MPHAGFWHHQQQYQSVLASSGNVVIASLLAFLASQILDITVYQRIKNASQGRWLWLRSNASTFIGQFVDSSIFIAIVFYASNNKLSILFGSLIIKMILSVAMTPFVYLIVMSANKYLNGKTLAFKLHESATVA